MDFSRLFGVLFWPDLEKKKKKIQGQIPIVDPILSRAHIFVDPGYQYRTFQVFTKVVTIHSNRQLNNLIKNIN